MRTLSIILALAITGGTGCSASSLTCESAGGDVRQQALIEFLEEGRSRDEMMSDGDLTVKLGLLRPEDIRPLKERDFITEGDPPREGSIYYIESNPRARFTVIDDGPCQYRFGMRAERP